MGVISTARLILLLDSVAAQKKLLDAACTEATGAADANTVAKGASNNWDRIDAYADDPDMQVELLGAARQNFLNANADSRSGESWAKPLILAVNRNVSGISAFCVANAIRVAPQAKKVVEACGLPALSYLATFSPAVDPMGTYTVGGAFVDGTAIDKTRYAPQMLTLYNATGAPTGVAAGTYSVTCKKYDGTTEVKAVVVPGGTLDAVEFDVGVAADKYWDVTLIAVAGGNAGDVVKIKAKVERTIDNADL